MGDDKARRVIKAAKQMGVPRKANSPQSDIQAFLRDVTQVAKRWYPRNGRVPADQVSTAVRRWQSLFQELIERYPKYEHLFRVNLGGEMSMGNSRGQDYAFAKQVRTALVRLSQYKYED